jgi:hypothetical protein
MNKRAAISDCVRIAVLLAASMKIACFLGSDTTQLDTVEFAASILRVIPIDSHKFPPDADSYKASSPSWLQPSISISGQSSLSAPAA